MRGADRDENAGFSNFEATEAVDDGQPVNGEFFMDQLTDLPHLAKGHGFVGFIIEVQGKASVGLISHEAIKSDNRSILPGADVAKQCCPIDRRVA